MKGILFTYLVSLLAFASPEVAADDQQLPEAQDRDGLRVTVTVVQPKSGVDKRLHFAVTLHNIRENDLMLNLGLMLANGKKQYPTGIDFFLANDKGIVKKLSLSTPAIAGRVDDYIVPLGVDATHTVVVNLDHYWCPAKQEVTVQLSEGTYKLVAVFVGKGAQFVNLDMKGVELMSYWMGKTVSEPLEFAMPSSK